ncbi:MAG: TetR/AcrR family transcriptional regulator [Tepidisphaeraceae bacterium]|jgi:AcrR family transcriptional regulator
MRLRDQNKHRSIVAAAAKFFSTQPFHKVRLEEVAQAAGVGKGTLYIYFQSKEDLYYSLVYDGFSELVGQLRQRLDKPGLEAEEKIRVIVKGLVDFSVGFPQFAEVMRTTAAPNANSQWGGKRRELLQLIEGTIRQGSGEGRLADTHPELTALYFLGMIRSVLLYAPRNGDADALSRHATGVILHGIGKARR